VPTDSRACPRVPATNHRQRLAQNRPSNATRRTTYLAQFRCQETCIQGKFRPAGRYLYFHYCVQVLRRAWRAGPGQKAVFSLQDQLGKLYWGTPGRYIPENMLIALVEELGNEYKELVMGASRIKGRRSTLLDVAVSQIASGQSGDIAEKESEDEEDEDEDEK
jgi:hypothetical protein